ncbi:hypothetical protein H5410_035170, partial [Solanum commersonii]
LIGNPVPLKPWESRESREFQLRAIDGQILEYQQLIASNNLKLTELRKENIDGVSPKIEWGETLQTVYLRVFYPKVKEQKIIFEDGNTCLVTCVAGEGEKILKILFGDYVFQVSKIYVGETDIKCILKKVDHKFWTKLVADETAVPYIIHLKNEAYWMSQFI